MNPQDAAMSQSDGVSPLSRESKHKSRWIRHYADRISQSWTQPSHGVSQARDRLARMERDLAQLYEDSTRRLLIESGY
jgi:hypothetical protein